MSGILGKYLKPIIFTVSAFGTGLLYSLIASETNEYFEDDNTSTSWMVSIFITSLILLLVMQTDGCGESIRVNTGTFNGVAVTSANRLVTAAYVTIFANIVLCIFYFMSINSNPSFKRRNFFIIGAIAQFLILIGGYGLWLQQSNLINTGKARVMADGPVVQRPMQQQYYNGPVVQRPMDGGLAGIPR
jgi:hypothetical protein